MMMNHSCDVLKALKGKTLATAESCTGGGIGAALTAVPGSSAVYKGGVICYSNWVKTNILGVSEELLQSKGPVCGAVAEEMASGVRRVLQADYSVSATGLAGPGGDEYGNPIGTVFIGLSSDKICTHRQYCFSGDRNAVREQAIQAAFNLILEHV